MSVYTPAYTSAYTAGGTSGTPGANLPLYLSFYDETSGSLTDPDSIQLDITYGSEVGLVPDVAGPFTYTGGANGTAVNVVIS